MHDLLVTTVIAAFALASQISRIRRDTPRPMTADFPTKHLAVSDHGMLQNSKKIDLPTWPGLKRRNAAELVEKLLGCSRSYDVKRMPAESPIGELLSTLRDLGIPGQVAHHQPDRGPPGRARCEYWNAEPEWFVSS